MSVVADCLSDHVSPQSDGEPGRITLGARCRTWLVSLRSYDVDHTKERQVVISEHDAEMRLSGRSLPSEAFSVYENGKRLGVEVSPIDAGLTVEGIAVRLTRILGCERVEHVTAPEIEAP